MLQSSLKPGLLSTGATPHSYPLARYVADRLERRTPVSAAYVNQHSIHIEDQDLGWGMFSCGWHGNIGAETGEPSNLGGKDDD